MSWQKGRGKSSYSAPPPRDLPPVPLPPGRGDTGSTVNVLPLTAGPGLPPAVSTYTFYAIPNASRKQYEYPDLADACRAEEQEGEWGTESYQRRSALSIGYGHQYVFTQVDTRTGLSG